MEPYRQSVAPEHGPRIAAIGGGTGLSTLLRGLKRYTKNITAIVTVADDGGGSGRLRQDLGMLPPGDIRNCLEALANAEPLMAQLMHYRFPEGELAGQSFGNLFLAALNGIMPSFDRAVESLSQVLAITGRVLPVTNENIQLEAEFENGARVVGESRIFQCKQEQDCRSDDGVAAERKLRGCQPKAGERYDEDHAENGQRAHLERGRWPATGDGGLHG